ncbi:unnamed protein product [Plutella xylostella]|uniref:(diamondback moth) hypothetical protein n=1 Tax=Plutella xylostella TaxID=51655 RepID=A0A8S4FWP2_PLUXY|nr:unnamed protein product [Plutella xylostella]
MVLLPVQLPRRALHPLGRRHRADRVLLHQLLGVQAVADVAELLGGVPPPRLLQHLVPARVLVQERRHVVHHVVDHEARAAQRRHLRSRERLVCHAGCWLLAVCQCVCVNKDHRIRRRLGGD